MSEHPLSAARFPLISLIMTMTADEDVPSPCVDLCKLDREAGTCLGCFRTREEIKFWKVMNANERRAVRIVAETRRLASLRAAEAIS
jgi:predicted Fe-S protein YdhL (DUF1289 family)